MEGEMYRSELEEMRVSRRGHIKGYRAQTLLFVVVKEQDWADWGPYPPVVSWNLDLTFCRLLRASAKVLHLV